MARDTLDGGRRDKLADRVIDEFLTRLRTGEIAVGQRLPPEPDLSKTFGVSRGTLREATTELARMGYLQVRQGSGTFVTEPDARALARPFRTLLLEAPRLAGELLQFRRLIEPEVAQLAAHNATDDDVATLRQLVAEQAEAVRFNRRMHREDTSFHHAIARIANNQFVLEILGTLRGALEEYRFQGDLNETVRQHERIVAAVAERDGEAARQAMIAHLEWVMEHADEHGWD